MRKSDQGPQAADRVYAASIKSELSDEWINTHLMRPAAGVVVRALYRTPVTPDQVTLASTAAGLIAALLYLHGTPVWTAAAGCCITVKDLLDSADGQLARAKALFSRRGRFLDSIGDFLVNALVFAAIGFTLWSTTGSSLPPFLAAAAFLSTSLRVSYHVFYQTAFLHLRNSYIVNRLTEEVRPEDLQEERATQLLQRIFLLLYGWQDGIMVRLDRWSRLSLPDTETVRQAWFSDPAALRLSGVIGLGTELFLLTVCSLADMLAPYLVLNVVGMNLVWGVAVVYRRTVVRRRIRKGL